MMDCLEAQRLISEQLDREPVDAALLDEAKDHCRSCEECAGYVRTLIALRRAPLPQPPSDLADRVMRAVAEAAAADQKAHSALTQPPTGESEAPELTDSVSDDNVSLDRFVNTIRERRNRRTVIAWVTAAALVFAVAGMGAIAGLRTMLTTPTGTRAPYEVEAAKDAAGDAALQQQASPASPEASNSAPQAAAPGYIVVSGVVYREAGQAQDVDPATLVVGGTTATALGGTTVITRQVLRGEDASRVFIDVDENALLAFDRVTRTYAGREYALRSANSLKRFGDWPSLPGGMTPPSDPSGAPQFARAGTDSAGVVVYRSTSGGSGTGIAIAPGTSPEDAAAGNPGWTWWEPLP